MTRLYRKLMNILKPLFRYAYKWRARLSAISLILALIVLVDEIVKENYAFDVHDLLAWPPPSHEQLFILLLGLGLLLGLRWRRGG